MYPPTDSCMIESPLQKVTLVVFRAFAQQDGMFQVKKNGINFNSIWQRKANILVKGRPKIRLKPLLLQQDGKKAKCHVLRVI